jgi:TonB-dependent starch-binding outer membrane protein SusC
MVVERIFFIPKPANKSKTMKKYKLISLLILSALFCMYGLSDIQAQARRLSTLTIASQVLDDNGEPMANVEVKSFRAKGRVLTATDGKFSIEVSQDITDQIVIDHKGYNIAVIPAGGGILTIEPITLAKKRLIDPANANVMPYMSVSSDRSVGAVSVITGEELASYPTGAVLTALSGRIPGLIVTQSSNVPGQEEVYATVRGSLASIFIDGILRDPVGLAISEIERIEVLKDMPGRSQLGVTGENPVIWITTKKGVPHNAKVTFSSEYGLHTPTVLPKYLDSYRYTTLYNEALANDGLTPAYSAADIEGYRLGTDLLHYPNTDYYGQYVAKSAPYRSGNLGFSGGDSRVTYYSNFHYNGHDGLETVGEELRSNLYKLRGNVNIELSDFMTLNVNIVGSYEKQRFANAGSGGTYYNYFDILSNYPANANAMYFGDKFLTSADYPVNIENEFLRTGFAEHINMNTQNNAKLTVDLGNVVKGLTFVGNAALDAYNTLATNKGGTAALYRLQRTSGGADTAVLITPESNVATMSSSYDYVVRRTSASMGFNYRYAEGLHKLDANAVYFMGSEEIKAVDDDYQPLKMQDAVFSANYAYNDRYVLQVDMAYSGTMKLLKGERFSLYPTVGAAWVISNESFMNQSSVVDYLKLYSSFGIVGADNFSMGGYNTFYLNETLWRSAGTWRSGYTGNLSSTVAIYNIVQQGSLDFTLPKKRYFNVGLQSTLLEKALSVEVNYFNNLYYDKISNLAMSTPSILGSGSFLPAVNYGEDVRWGFDGMIQYSGNVGGFTYSAGVNGMYQRAKFIDYDEPDALPEYRKRAGKDMDLFWLYQADGLFQNATEILNHDAIQSWGTLKPGDIRYVDFNDDGLIDEADIHSTDAHTPRIAYGVNFSAGYKGFRIFALGQGIADGQVLLSSNRYFRINGTRQNYSEFMLDRFPETNNVPRLTTQSTNNTQNSTFWLANASYFRLRNVEVSYSIPATVTHNFRMTDLTVFARGTNLLTMSALNQYSVEPEDINAGITKYPMLRTITFGVSARF